ncbi:TPA: SH3 domain-containing protein [Raoultella planticola]|jgi:uncharacterized protein YgiM (DUF1202 family)|uniref:SH3 domain-containing protein n=1 Tax=Raoultella TaxID=160674 RepID=UPI000A192D1D|nr:SH3 domain-containing protein [Raoultella sp. YJ]ATM07419.1 SH3 domain-containing protein [Raoultella planticola]ATM15370.1 SH3 domain-containing protein [Raoultella planticola]ELU0691720.1 SH3 domain-containing protein [Raoultella planticola]MCS7493490.1 SH3 domain-containing protein [Raoultella planticola]MDC3911314.1 SH3 domain-containing protein [Raoultella planticola]
MSEQAKIGYANANALKVRSTPNGSPLESLQRGAQVKIYEQQNNWSRISIANEKERWVSSSYLCESANCYVKKVTPPFPAKLRTEHPPPLCSTRPHKTMVHHAPALQARYA